MANLAVRELKSPSTFAPRSDPKWEGLLGHLEALVSNPERERFRQQIGVPTMPAVEIRAVSSDSMCNRAGALMNRERHLPDSTSHRVRLVRLRSRFWAEDDDHAGEWIQGLILDSAMTKVISVPGR